MGTTRKPIEIYRGVEIFESHAFFEFSDYGLIQRLLYDAKFSGIVISGTLSSVRQQIDGLLQRSTKQPKLLPRQPTVRREAELVRS